VDFGLQQGRGSGYVTVQTRRSDGEDLMFTFIVEVKAGLNGVEPDFGGPFVQGPQGERVVYLDIGTLAGQADCCWSRRMKIPLSGITWQMIRSGGVLEGRVPGTGTDGGPACATVKEFGGWKSRKK
jgi:hypothetical protein